MTAHATASRNPAMRELQKRSRVGLRRAVRPTLEIPSLHRGPRAVASPSLILFLLNASAIKRL
jgi:hypothetical protein